ncbi:hypothetical protein GALMADRAFT_933925 [Galerina marginata CBS 339.88]|uniref:Uncharacterized protein n=1 Tax=Galerina marginata (strain CBS 339.88) TaxID=685588 RepID=A0A067SDS0_GALM3|nr:hypothetical protein GALMADRAFT_933925 [Galerina marginata CBS 339.88]
MRGAPQSYYVVAEANIASIGHLPCLYNGVEPTASVWKWGNCNLTMSVGTSLGLSGMRSADLSSSHLHFLSFSIYISLRSFVLILLEATHVVIFLLLLLLCTQRPSFYPERHGRRPMTEESTSSRLCSTLPAFKAGHTYESKTLVNGDLADSTLHL